VPLRTFVLATVIGIIPRLRLRHLRRRAWAICWRAWRDHAGACAEPLILTALAGLALLALLPVSTAIGVAGQNPKAGKPPGDPNEQALTPTSASSARAAPGW